MTDELWSRDYIRSKLKVSKVTLSLASGYVTVVSAPLSGALRHIQSVTTAPDIAGSGDVNFAFAAVRTSGASGSETEKHVFPQVANTERKWGGSNIQDEVLQLKLGEELVGRGVISGVTDMESLWWEE